MRKDLLIISLIALVLGFAIGGSIGNILLIVGILLLLYVVFSRESYREHPVNMEYYEEKNYKENRKPEYHNRNRTEKRLKFSDDNQWKEKINKCPECGSTNNPANAAFCANCGEKLK